MNTILYLMYGIEVLVAVLLILVILVQRSKAGGGLGGLATNSAGVEEAFGSGAGNVLVKTTVWLGIIFLINTVGIGIIQKGLSLRAQSSVDPTVGLATPTSSSKTPVKTADKKVAPAKVEVKADKKVTPAKADVKAAPAEKTPTKTDTKTK